MIKGSAPGSDLTGRKVGWWTVLHRAERPAESTLTYRGSWWLCQCRCGRREVLPRQYIVAGQSSSCGCKRKRKSSPNELSAADVVRMTAMETKCKACGRKFPYTGEWRYKTQIGGRTAWYCSWSCYRAGDVDRPRVSLTERAAAQSLNS